MALAVTLALGVACTGTASGSASGVGRQTGPAASTDPGQPSPAAATTAPSTALGGSTPDAASSGPIAAASPSPRSSQLPGGPIATRGAIALVENDGSLTLVTAAGRATRLAVAGDSTFSFPAWSPDGSRIATVRSGAATPEILVFDATRAAAGQPVDPTVIFRSGSVAPFYVAWTPDGQSVAFLATEAGTLSLRLAPADGSAPLDGSGPRSKVRDGDMLFFDWADRDGVLAHVGTGPSAFLGEIGFDGAAKGLVLPAPGNFRSADVSVDGSLVSYVRAPTLQPAEVVVAARDGSTETSMPVYGSAAVGFGPTGTAVASIGPSEAGQSSFAVPFGPLRLLDGDTGRVRTLVDGSVASFWWSPDGRTIAALRVQPVGSGSSSTSKPTTSPMSTPAAPASPSPAPTAGPAATASPQPSGASQPTEIRLVFADVASGKQTSTVVQPGRLYIDQFLTYFDQYARSHRVWSPDSSSILVPVVGDDGTTRISVLHRNGDRAETIDGAIGFWSP